MKILVISSNFPNRVQPNNGLYIYELLKHQQKFNDIIVISPVSLTPPKYSLISPKQLVNWLRERFKIPHQTNYKGITVFYPRIFYLPKFISFWTEGIILFLRLIPLARKIRKKFNFELIHAHFAFPEGFAGTLLAKLFHIPSVITYHGNNRNFKPQIIKFLLNNASKNIIVSKILTQKLTSQVDVNNGYFNVIHNGVDITKFFPRDELQARKTLGLPLDKQITLYIGNLYPHDGINYLIDAFEVISTRNRDILLYIVGDGYLKDALQRKIKKLNLENQVFLVENFDLTKTPLWLNAANLYIFPGLLEGLPPSIIEAMACGTPVVANDIGGIREIIPSNELGLLVIPRDYNELAQKILAGLQKVWNKDELITRAKAFSWEKIAIRTQKCYDSIFKRDNSI